MIFDPILNSACRREESAPWQLRRAGAAGVADKSGPCSSRLPPQKERSEKSEFVHVRNPNLRAGLQSRQRARLLR
jgi:hypothetical protein